jgi:hypothetical protein
LNNFTKIDVMYVKNLLSLVKRGKYELEGSEEIVACANSINWLARILADAEKELAEPPPAPASIQPEPIVPAKKSSKVKKDSD